MFTSPFYKTSFVTLVVAQIIQTFTVRYVIIRI